MADLNFGVNVALHMIILFGFLSLFFVFYITKVSKRTLEKELRHDIENAIHNGLGPYRDQIGMVAEKLPLDTLNRMYSKPEKTMEMNNRWLFHMITAINVGLWALFFGVVTTLKYGGVNINLKELMLENAVTFSFIGIVEYLFFTRVALKFVPVEPSFITQQFITSLKSTM